MPANDIATRSGEKPHVVHVALGERAYDVLIGQGLASDLGTLLPERFGGKAILVMDETVAGFHGAPIEAALARAKLLRGSVHVPSGERSKSFEPLAALCSKLLSLGLERGDTVVALGGGVIGDLAGFAAHIVRRGVRFVQVPTTLLALVDSSVGGKTGINTTEGKNLVGAFQQPALVVADTDLLATLSSREMAAGYAEVVKYGILGNAPFFAWLEAHGADVLAKQPEALAHAVSTSVAMKARIVERDETEMGERRLLNLGHTFGHAFEAAAGFSQALLHGEAVALGTALAARMSEARGLCAPGTAARIEAHLRASSLPTRASHIAHVRVDTDQLVALMGQDKKVRDGKLTLILLRKLGEAYATQEVPLSDVYAFLKAELKS